ncbi:hypothetical protein D1872_331550 [compost metagenome]
MNTLKFRSVIEGTNPAGELLGDFNGKANRRSDINLMAGSRAAAWYSSLSRNGDTYYWGMCSYRWLQN